MYLTWLSLVVVSILTFTQDGANTSITLDLKSYPQATAKEAFASVLKAIDDKRFDYLVAHLADPSFVTDRVKRIYNGRIEEQIQDTQTRLNPATVKLLRRFATEGTWTIGKQNAIVELKDQKARVVRFVKRSERWYLSNDDSPEK